MYLGIETSSLVSSVAVGTGVRLYGEITVQAALTHSEQLVPHIQQVLTMANVDKKKLKAIVVSIGPGSFTGLRIGLGTAKALAYGLSIPLFGIMTMEAMAYNAMYSNRLIAVLIDAQKNNVYEALYRFQGKELVCVQQPHVISLEESLQSLANREEPILFMGDGTALESDFIESYASQFEIAPPHMCIPRAESLLAAAKKRINEEDFDDPMTVVPFYLRRSEAEVLWDKKHASKGAEQS